MNRSLSRFLALLAALGLITPPALGIPSASSPSFPTSSLKTPLTIDESACEDADAESTAGDDSAISDARELTQRRETITDRLVELGDEPRCAVAATSRLTQEDLAVLSDHPEMLQRAGAGGGGRARVTAQLMALDYDIEIAHQFAACLTPDDLVVLLNNPEMMQRAGGLGVSATAWIVGGLIVGAFIVLAVSSNSSGSIMVN